MSDIKPTNDFFSRRSIRNKGFDYKHPGFYFVTICSFERCCIFGCVQQNKIVLSEMGSLVHKFWREIPTLNTHVQLDEFVIMPNHLHGILHFSDEHLALSPTEGVAVPRPYIRWQRQQINSTKAGSLQTIIRSFKAACTKAARHQFLTDRVWQRGYFEHIIRREATLLKIRQYIRDNPTKWQLDELFAKEEGRAKP
jgi:putative transposase